MRIVLYSASVNKLGGIDTFNYNWCKRMRRLAEVVFVYANGAEENVSRFRDLGIEVIKFNNKPIDCDVCIWSTAWGVRPERYINAKKYGQVVHADYKHRIDNWTFQYIKLPKVSFHIAVGEHVAKSFRSVTGYDCKVIHNMLDKDAVPEKVLRLITASRMSKEKGFERVVEMAKALHGSGRPFVWLIFGDAFDAYSRNIKEQLDKIPGVVFMGVRTDVKSYVADCDYLVQLSDSEGFSYSTYEALQMGTPVICTDYPSAHEQVTGGVNGFILKMDLSNLDIEKLYEGIAPFEFKELSSEKEWIQVMKKAPAKAKAKKVAVKVIRVYEDVEQGKRMNVGETFETTDHRAEELKNAKVAVLA